VREELSGALLELVEATPQSIGLRKRYLDPHVQKKASRKEQLA